MAVATLLDTVAQYATSHPDQALAVASAVVGGLAHYRKTNKLPIGRLPWRAIRGIAGELGDQYFGRSRPRGVPGVVVDAAPADVAAQLRTRHYESADLYSYEYAGERFGFRRPSGVRSHPETGRDVPMETHPRGFETSDGRTLVICHDEASRFEAQGAHLGEALLSWERGREILVGDLQALELPYETIESEAAEEMEVVA